MRSPRSCKETVEPYHPGMAVPWTLHRYIFWEMGKTFGLAVAALTGVLGLGGGILNMIKLGEVTPDQLFRLIALVLPLAAALTLPVAALFAATSTYGRLSADNEFVACRASGINLHVLFIPTLILSLGAAVVSFALTNFLIPGMVRNLNTFVSADIGALIRQRLSRPQGIRLGKNYRLYAGETQVDQDNPNEVILRRVAFIELEQQDWVRYGTAREVILTLEQSDSGLTIAGVMSGLSCYDRNQDLFYEEARQTIPPNHLRAPVPQKIKFLKLPELLHFWSNPSEWIDVRSEMAKLRRAVGARLAYQNLQTDWNGDHTISLSDADLRLAIEAKSCGLIPGDRGVELADVTVLESRNGRTRTVTAKRAVLEVNRGDTVTDTGIKIELFDATLSDGNATVDKQKVVLGPVRLDTDLVARVEAMSDSDLLDEKGSETDDRLNHRRAEARAQRDKTVRKIAGAIHERFAYSVSMFVLVILGAVLGIVFRGSHIMTAFGISFVPALLVIVSIMAGKQMATNEATHIMGLTIMWSGIVAVAGLDLWTLTRVLRR